jgi:hypothetical protein
MKDRVESKLQAGNIDATRAGLKSALYISIF